MDDSRHDSVRCASVIRIVIVDDDLLVRTLLTKLLNSYSDLNVVNTYADGAMALEALPSDQADVMLLDVHMPNSMGGVEVTRKVRELAPSVKIIALTSLTDEMTVAEMLRAGALCFLFKDTAHEAIADAIRAARSGLSVLTPKARNPLTNLAPQNVPELTETEHRVLKLVAEGFTNEQIGRQVYLSPSTVKYHVGMLAEKLGATNRVTLAVRAGELHLL